MLVRMQVVAAGQATVVFLDSAYRPTRVPAEPKRVFSALQAEYSGSNGGGGGGS